MHAVIICWLSPAGPSMNTQQKDELFSLACIYEDSKEVVLQLPDSKKEEVDYEIVVKLDVSTCHKIQMQIWTLCFALKMLTRGQAAKLPEMCLPKKVLQF